MDSVARISKITVFSAFAVWIIVALVKLNDEEIIEVAVPKFDRDYDKIAESRTLNVALIENVTEYCIFNANPRGFQLETLEDFCNDHNLELNIIPVATEQEAEKTLADEKCDIIVKHTIKHDTTCMSNTMLNTSLVVLTRTKQLHDTIYTANKLQSFFKNDTHTIIYIDSLSSEKIARQVATGKIKSAICDSAIALAYQKAYPQLTIDTTILVGQQVVWKTHSEAKVLRDSINAWLSRIIDTKEFKLRHEIYYSYINIKVSSNYYSGKNDQISAYDDLIRKQSKRFGWDWRLIASLICEESRFNPDISNPSGAYGLMQLMPNAYQKFANDSADITNPEIQVIAGMKHIEYLRKRVPETIKDSSVIIKYVLMGYNAGHGHADDAYKLAEKHSQNPASWDNLSEYMTLLSDKKYYTDSVVKCGKYNGKRTVAFTNSIINRYKHYRNLIKD